MNRIHFFTALSKYIEVLIVNGGYPLIFISTLLEGIPLFGMLVPGHVALLLAGFSVKIGFLNMYVVSIVALTGAIVGDFMGFYIGRKYGMSFIDRFKPYFFIKDEHIEKVRGILSKHTGKAMIIGRFTPMTRALMPFLVGSSDAHVKKFWFYNIVGAIGWVMSSILLGYIFGAGYHAVSKYFGKIVILAILASGLVVWGYRFVNVRFHIFRRFELFVLGLNMIALYTLAKTIQDTLSVRSSLVNFDAWVSVYVVSNIKPIYVNIASFVSNIGGIISLEIAGIIIGIYLFAIKRYRSAVIMLSSVIVTGFATGIVKEIFMSPRPENQFVKIALTDPSFPSAHASVSAAFFVALMYIFLPKINSLMRRELFIVFSVIVVASVGISRLVLNVHWFSDVMAGWAFGIFVTTSIILLVKYIGVLLKR